MRSTSVAAAVLLLLVVAASMQPALVAAVSITSFGAVAGDPSNEAAHANVEAITKAFAAANAASKASERVVLVPAGRDFTFFNVTLRNLKDVKLQVDGRLLISNNVSAANWPQNTDYGALQFEDCDGLEFTGAGEINGQGYNFWWHVILTTQDYRPHMFKIIRSRNIHVHHAVYKDSPQYHLNFYDALNVQINDVQIIVNVTEQKSLLRRHGKMHPKTDVPVFPLNTDGIDLAARNVTVERVYIANFDDAVAVKPLSGNNVLSQCSQDMVIRDSQSRFSVGMTIGSVPPDVGVNCIKNVVFQNIFMLEPYKAVYIKTNPGDTGSGIIQNILYENLTAVDSLWYPIWIGPQQQHQPGTPGNGCYFEYPIIPICPTEPRILITDIVLKDMTFTGGLTLPGVLLCNATRPCTNFDFRNVQNNGEFLVQKDYVCQNVQGTTENSSPAPQCF